MLKIGDRAVLLVTIVAVFVVATHGRDPNLEALERESREYILKLDKISGERKHRATVAEWNYTANITKENEERRIQISLEISKQEKQSWEETRMYKWQDFQDFTLRRMFKQYTQLGTAALSNDKFELLMKTVSDMQLNYATSKVCSYKDPKKCDLSLEPEFLEDATLR